MQRQTDFCPSSRGTQPGAPYAFRGIDELDVNPDMAILMSETKSRPALREIEGAE